MSSSTPCNSIKHIWEVKNVHTWHGGDVKILCSEPIAMPGKESVQFELQYRYAYMTKRRTYYFYLFVKPITTNFKSTPVQVKIAAVDYKGKEYCPMDFHLKVNKFSLAKYCFKCYYKTERKTNSQEKDESKDKKSYPMLNDTVVFHCEIIVPPKESKHKTSRKGKPVETDQPEAKKSSEAKSGKHPFLRKLWNKFSHAFIN